MRTSHPTRPSAACASTHHQAIRRPSSRLHHKQPTWGMIMRSALRLIRRRSTGACASARTVRVWKRRRAKIQFWRVGSRAGREDGEERWQFGEIITNATSKSTLHSPGSHANTLFDQTDHTACAFLPSASFSAAAISTRWTRPSFAGFNGAHHRRQVIRRQLHAALLMQRLQDRLRVLFEAKPRPAIEQVDQSHGRPVELCEVGHNLMEARLINQTEELRILAAGRVTRRQSRSPASGSHRDESA